MLNLPQKTISRMAPTPSGYLHLGNALNFILTWVMVRKAQGQLWLRIDDLDVERSRPEFVDDIFWTIGWLGINYDKGPADAEDFYHNFSQQTKTEFYRSKLHKLEKQAKIYACECSRKEIGAGPYPGTCRDKKLKYDSNLHSLRIQIDEVHLEKSHGDFVVWRKGDTPSYQLVSLIEDQGMESNLIVRGEDLIDSTILQKYLAKKLKYSHFMNAKFIHHKMIATRNGEKLSKSNQDLSIRYMAENGALPRDIFKEVALALNIDEAKDIQTAQDFYEAYSIREIQ